MAFYHVKITAAITARDFGYIPKADIFNYNNNYDTIGFKSTKSVRKTIWSNFVLTMIYKCG